MYSETLNLQFFIIQLQSLKYLNYWAIILPISFSLASFALFDNSLAFCMPDFTLTDCVDFDTKTPSAKYVICDVKYDRAGELIRNANVDPTQFCNKHESQISAIFDRAMSSVDKQQHQLAMTPSNTK